MQITILLFPVCALGYIAYGIRAGDNTRENCHKPALTGFRSSKFIALHLVNPSFPNNNYEVNMIFIIRMSISINESVINRVISP